MFFKTGTKNDLATRLAHDIRSPLAALALIAEKSAGESLNEDEARVLSMAIKRIRGIADDLLNENRATQSVSESFDANEAVKEIIQEKMVAHPDIRFHMQLPKDLVTVKGNKPEFLRALSNLVSNCIEGRRIEKELKVKIRCVGGKLGLQHIVIEDNGRGIPDHVLIKLLDEPITFGKPHGNGIGLFSAKKMLSAMGLNLQIKSRLGYGTTVSLIGPLATQQAKPS